MNKTRNVRQHDRRKTVHELDASGDTLCRNGRGNGYARYTTFQAWEVAGQRACLSCAWVRLGHGQAAAVRRIATRGFQP